MRGHAGVYEGIGQRDVARTCITKVLGSQLDQTDGSSLNHLDVVGGRVVQFDIFLDGVGGDVKGASHHLRNDQVIQNISISRNSAAPNGGECKVVRRGVAASEAEITV